MAEVELPGGIKFKGGKIFVILTALTTAGGALAWEDIGTSDQRINFTNSAATNSGEVRITVTYQHNTNYA